MDKLQLWVGGLSFQGDPAADKQDDIYIGDRDWRVSRLSAIASSGLGYPQAGDEVFRRLSKTAQSRERTGRPLLTL